MLVLTTLALVMTDVSLQGSQKMLTLEKQEKVNLFIFFSWSLP